MGRNDLQPYPVNQTIQVTDEDIKFGIANDSMACAIARSIWRTFPDALRVRVTRKTISWSDPVTDSRFVYPTPMLADAAVIKPFDTGGEVKPVRFVLSGGQFRTIDHKTRKEHRDAERERKRRDPEGSYKAHHPKGYNDHVHPGSKIYDRYIPTIDEL